MGLFGKNKYRASPMLKMQVMALYPNLKVAEMEALTQFAINDAEEAANYIKHNLSENCFKEFKEKVRSVDPKAAKYLDEVN